MPERVAISIAGDDAARARIASALDARAQVVERERAEIAFWDAPSARDALAAIAEGFTLPTVLLVDDPHAELAHAALSAGAFAVLARQSDARELQAALDAVAQGLLVIDAGAREAFAARTGAAPAPGVDMLTQREREVLAMLARGLSNRRIADRLGIRENTVKAHVAAVLAKLGAATRTEAVTAGIRRGLVFL